nr:IS3 family transposase [Paenibacillus sp. PL91]
MIRQENIYLAIQALQQGTNASIKVLCEVAEIPRSSYYKWLQRMPSARELANQQLTEAMITLHEKVGGIYGYRRLTLHLCRQTQQQINHKRIQRLMRLKGIHR